MTSVISRNPFDLLMSEESPAETAPAPAPASEPAKKKYDQKPKPSGVRHDYPQRGGYRGGNRAAAPRANQKQVGEESTDDSKPAKHGGHTFEKDGRRAYKGSNRGRAYDRHSGTGRRDTVKKEQAGSATWGEPISAATEGTNETSNANPEEGAEAQPPRPLTPEEEVKTLDQYYAEKNVQAAKLNVVLPQTRQANEGVDNSQWENTVVLSREDESEMFSRRQKTNKVKQQRSQKTTQVIEIEQRFNDDNNRGGRGRPIRGNKGGNRNNHRSSRGNAPVNVNDETAFPSLGQQ